MAKKKVTHFIVDRYVNLELFNRHQEPGDNGCINWTGIVSNVGYGFIGFKRRMEDHSDTTRMMSVHRLAWMLHHNRAPAKPNINHTCHNKLCVNPEHLYEGTQQEKLVEMRRDNIYMGGRPVGTSGYAYNHKQQNRTYKYSEAEIDWVRTAPIDDIAKKYNITRNRAQTKQWTFRKGYTWHKTPEAK